MKKYKLIKEYPGRKIGDIAIVNKTLLPTFEWEINKEFQLNITIPYEFTNSDFFEEIIDKEWQILEFYGIISAENNSTHKERKDIYLLDNYKYKDGAVGYILMGMTNEVWALDECVKFLKIHKVKNQITNEIFTIGDKTNYDTILNFYIISNKMKVICGGGSSVIEVNLNDLKKSKYIFKTEDDIEIFIKDKYYTVDSTFIIKENNCITTSGSRVNLRYFSTYDKAQEYVILNSNIFSLQQIIDNTYHLDIDDIDRLKLLAKNYIKF